MQQVLIDRESGMVPVAEEQRQIKTAGRIGLLLHNKFGIDVSGQFVATRHEGFFGLSPQTCPRVHLEAMALRRFNILAV